MKKAKNKRKNENEDINSSAPSKKQKNSTKIEKDESEQSEAEKSFLSNVRNTLRGITGFSATKTEMLINLGTPEKHKSATNLLNRIKDNNNNEEKFKDFFQTVLDFRSIVSAIDSTVTKSILVDLNKYISEYIENCDNINQELNKIKREKLDLEETVTTLESDNDTLQKGVDSYSKANDTLTKKELELNDEIKELKKIDDAYKELKSKYSQLEKNSIKSTASVEKKNKINESLSKDIEKIKNENEKLKEEYNKLKSENGILIVQLEHSKSEIDEKNKSISDLEITKKNFADAVHKYHELELKLQSLEQRQNEKIIQSDLLVNALTTQRMLESKLEKVNNFFIPMLYSEQFKFQNLTTQEISLFLGHLNDIKSQIHEKFSKMFQDKNKPDEITKRIESLERAENTIDKERNVDCNTKQIGFFQSSSEKSKQNNNMQGKVLIQNLLEKASIINSNSNLKKIQFNTLNDAKNFVGELLKIGFGNQNQPQQAKKIESVLFDDHDINNNSNNEKLFIVELTADEWKVLMPHSAPKVNSFELT